MYDIQEIQVKTASSNAESGPEMRLVGLHDPLEIRSKILKVRDSQNGTAPQHTNSYQGDGNGYNPLLADQVDPSRAELQRVIESQTETMSEIKDVLVDMKAALQSMNAKTEQRDHL